ncbi:MAG: LSU ribosomal protein L29p (L35e), partial [uncultured Thermomicrobiales bacterium]
ETGGTSCPHGRAARGATPGPSRRMARPPIPGGCRQPDRDWPNPANPEGNRPDPDHHHRKRTATTGGGKL